MLTTNRQNWSFSLLRHAGRGVMWACRYGDYLPKYMTSLSLKPQLQYALP